MSMDAPSFQLRYTERLTIARGLDEEALRSALPELQGSRADMRTGWVWYTLPVFASLGTLLGVSLGFNRGVLETISLADCSSEFGTSWEEWSKEKQSARAASISAWLTRHGYPPGSYSWGDVWVGYDAKSGSGSARVRFAV
jgi:hypothetical protein